MIRVFPSGGDWGGSPLIRTVSPLQNQNVVPPHLYLSWQGLVRFFYHRTDYTNLTNSKFKDDSVIHDLT